MSQKSILAVSTARSLTTRYRFLSVHHRLYVYEEGCYRDNEEHIRQAAQRELGSGSERAVLDEIVHWLCTEYRVDPATVDAHGLVNVKNGLLDPVTGELTPHSPDIQSIVQLPVAWNPDAYHQRADKFLTEVLPSAETRQLLEEFVGYCLLPDCRYEKAAMLTGTGANGKSTFIRWLTAMLGRENVSALSLQDLSRERFRLAPIVGKLANSFADLPRAALNEAATFKALVSGDELTAEEKYRKPFMFRNRAKLVFSANELPRSRDTTVAFFRRWVIVPFPSVFPEGDPRRDPRLGTELESVRAGAYLLRLGVNGLRRLISNDAFTQTPENVAALEQYRRDTDSVRAFVEDYCVVERSSQVRRSELYGAYRERTEQAGLRPVSLPLFGRRLHELVPGIDEFQPRADGGRPRCYVGIALRSGDAFDFLHVGSATDDS